MKFTTCSSPRQCEDCECVALGALVDAFAAEMKRKLRAKCLEDGYTGWDDPDWAGSDHPEDSARAALRDHVHKGDPVDVANFAAFIWNAQEEA